MAAACVALGIGCGGASPARIYSGETDQRFPVRIRVAGDGKRLTFRIVWSCPVVAGLAPLTTHLRGMPVVLSQADTFATDVDYTYALSDATRARVQGQLSGRLTSGGGASGVWHPRLTYEDPESPAPTHCDPGAIAFTARRT